MSEQSITPDSYPLFSELRDIHEAILLLASELPDRVARHGIDRAQRDLSRLANRLDKQIAITPAYTGPGNDVIANSLRKLLHDFYGKFETLADSIDPSLNDESEDQ